MKGVYKSRHESQNINAGKALRTKGHCIPHGNLGQCIMYQAGRSVAILNANIWGNQSFQEKSGWERAVSLNIAVLINEPPFFCHMGSEPGSEGKQNTESLTSPTGKKAQKA